MDIESLNKSENDLPLNEAPTTPSGPVLYLKNLNEKIKDSQMVSALSKIFSGFGEIIDIKIKNTCQMKGQAFITYKELSSAEKALKKLNDSILFNKKLIIQFARAKSDTYLKSKNEFDENEYTKRRLRNSTKRDQFYKEFKEKQTSHLMSEKAILNNAPSKSVIGGIQSNANQPTSKLFINNISSTTDESDLKPLFSKIPGLREIRLMPERHICFVDYENELQAERALLAYSLVEVKGIKLNIKFAKV